MWSQALSLSLPPLPTGDFLFVIMQCLPVCKYFKYFDCGCFVCLLLQVLVFQFMVYVCGGCMPNLTLQMQPDFLVGMDTQNFALFWKISENFNN
jgi:hypothetical protein